MKLNGEPCDILIIAHEDGRVSVAPETLVVRLGQNVTWLVLGGTAVVYPAQNLAAMFTLPPDQPIPRVVETPGPYCIVVTSPAGKKLGAMAVLIVDP